jgi:hypothetical protein
MRVFNEVAEEIQRQESIWGVQNHDDPYWMTIALEELGEAAMAILAKAHNANPRTTRLHTDNTRTELVQTAAVIINWIECIDRR